MAPTEEAEFPATRVVESPFPFVAPRRERGRITVSDGELSWHGAPIAQRRRLTMAYVVPPIGEEPAKLHIQEDGFEELVFDVRLSDGRDLLVALELDAARSIVRLAIPPLSRTWPTVGSLLIAAPIAAMIGAFIAPSTSARIGLAWAIPISLLVLMLASLSSTRVVISADAIEVSWFALYRRRIAFRDVRGVERTALGIRVDVARGKPLELRTAVEEPAQRVGVVFDPLAGRRARQATLDAEALFERISEARRAYALPAPIPFDASTFDRAGRTVDEWMSHLRGLREFPTAHYRNVALDLERVWALVLDPRAKPTIRAGALVVVAPSIDDARERQLRSLARGLLDEPLRRAIEACLTRDEAAMREAMGALG